MTQYTATTLNAGTRVRKDHNTFSTVLTSILNAKTVITGNELWIAPADGAEVKAGDKWLKVSYGMFTGWVAIVHKGVAICDNFKEVSDVPPPVDPPLETVFPMSFTLTDPKGNKAEYQFVRLVP